MNPRPSRIAANLFLIFFSSVHFFPVSGNSRIENQDLIVDQIVINNQNIFDLNTPSEQLWYTKIINRLHYRTRESTIRRELFLREGRSYHPEILDETERYLRRRPYLADARISADTPVDHHTNVTVWTRDSWSTDPGFNFSSAGGQSKYRFHLDEKNLFGTGTHISTEFSKDADRNTLQFEYDNRNLFGRHDELTMGYGHATDGINKRFKYAHPFYAIWEKREYGVNVFQRSREQSLLTGGSVSGRYKEDVQTYDAYYGRRLSGNMNSAFRLTGGYRFGDRHRKAVSNLSPALVPPSQRLSGLFIEGEWDRQHFIKRTNLDAFNRVEDINLAPVVSLETFGNLFAGENQRGVEIKGNFDKGFAFGERHLVKNNLNFFAKYDHNGLTNSTLSTNTYWYYSWRSAHTFVMHIQSDLGLHLDGSNPITLGGENGLRGYPTHNFSGNWKLLFNIEDRIFTPVTFFHTIRLGGVFFYNAGDAGTGHLGPLKQSVGLGLRLGILRSATTSVIRMDMATALQPKYVPSGKRLEFSVSTGQAF